jgi:hypothetical protein
MWKKISIVFLFFLLLFAYRYYQSYSKHKSNATIEKEWQDEKNKLNTQVITPESIAKQHQSQKERQGVIKDQTIWDKLTAVRYETKANGYLPFFDSRQLALQGTAITIEGYFIQTEVSPSSNYFLLSLYPYQSCFFCGGASIASIVEVETKQALAYTDKPITLKGTLQLNKSIDDAFFYSLKNAEIVK